MFEIGAEVVNGREGHSEELSHARLFGLNLPRSSSRIIVITSLQPWWKYKEARLSASPHLSLPVLH